MEDKKITMDELVQSEGWKKFMNKMDLYCAIFLGILFLMIITGNTDNKIFRLLSHITLITLAATSFFIAYNRFESESGILKKWFYKIYGIGLSLGFVTILYMQRNWKFPIEIFSIVSVFMLVVSLILGIKEVNNENKNKLNWIYFLRLFIALVPLIFYIIKLNVLHLRQL